jgi:hypothetical protein
MKENKNKSEIDVFESITGLARIKL